MDPQLLLDLGAGLLLGAVLGVERGWASRGDASGMRVAGLRSFALTGLLGALAAVTTRAVGPWAGGLTFLAVLLLVLVSYAITSREASDFGITTELALLLAFLLGLLAASGHRGEAAGATVAVALVLGLKRELHGSLLRLERRELLATLQLLAVAVLVLPLLPDRGLGPGGVWNPRKLGLLVLLLAGISYVGWFAVRWLGVARGLTVTSLLGGLTSSTAVTLACARWARARRAPAPVLAAGVLLACAMMGPRVLFEVAVVERSLAGPLVLPLLALSAVPVAAALWLLARARGGDEAPELALRNPLELEAAVVYGLLLGAILLAVRVVQAWIGPTGVYAVAAISAVVDVDALALGMADAVGGGLPVRTGAGAVLLAASVNTGVKGALAAAVGGRALGRLCVPVLAGGLALAWLAAAVHG